MLRRVNTIIKPVTADSIAQAAGVISRGGLVAFPTETVYGLGANGLDPRAGEAIYAAKSRPPDNPLILHVSEVSMAYGLASEVSATARRLMSKFWPGALTIVLPKKSHIPDVVSGGLSTVGIRMPAHETARALIACAGVPIAAPSANSSGRPSPTRAAHVAEDLGGRVHMILDGGHTLWGLESTVVEVTGSGLCVLRPGAVTVESLRRVVPKVYLSDEIISAPKAPGMKYRHYSPRAEVTLVTGAADDIVRYIKTLSRAAAFGILATDQTVAAYGKDHRVISMGDRNRPEQLAARLFDCFREFDRLGVAAVYAEGVEERGLGLAIGNRMRKAAGGRVIKV